MKRYVRLGVNIDHVATLRNARGENYPKVTEAARIVEKMEEDGIISEANNAGKRHVLKK